MAERKRIIALARERAKAFDEFSGSRLGSIVSQTLRNFANELENGSKEQEVKR